MNDTVYTVQIYPIASTRHNFRLGGNSPGYNPTAKLLTAEEMWGIDTKIDDGKPGLGGVISYLSSVAWNPDCASSDVPGTAEYELTITSRECRVFLDAGF